MKNPRRRVGQMDKHNQNKSRAKLGRVLRAEALEARQLLAGDVGDSPHQNSWYSRDVNNDLRVTAMDALVVINELNRGGSRDLNGEAVRPQRFYDVNGDNQLTAIDALQVINALNRGSGEDVPVVEIQLGLTDDEGNSLLNPGTRTADLAVGDIVNLEVLYTDARTFGTGLGLFTVYTDILASQAGFLEPLVTETQVLSLSENLVDSLSGSVTLSQAGTTTTAVIPLSALATNPAGAVKNAIVANFGYTADEIFTSLETREPRDPANGTPVGDPFDVFVRFIGDRFVDQDIPNFAVDASNLVTSNGVEVIGSTREISPRLPNGSINPLAVGFSLDTRSRTGGGANIYTNAREGEFNDDPTDDIDDGFIGIGGVGQLVGGGIPAILGSSVPYVPSDPFEAFSIRTRVVRPVEGLSLQIRIPTEQVNDGGTIQEETRLLIYGNFPNSSISGDERGLFPQEVVVDSDGTLILNVTEELSARADILTVAEDGTQSINPLLNDLNRGTAPLRVIATTNGANGAVTFTADRVTYTPAADFFGVDSFTYTIENGDGNRATGTVNVTVNPVNDLPTAQDFGVTVTEGVERVIVNSEFISRSSAGPANENQTATLVSVNSTGSRGTAVLNTNGSVTYTAPTAYQGPDSFTYTISDGVATVTATVNVTVVDQNDPPVAGNDTITVVEDTPVNYTAAQVRANILANDVAGPPNEVANGQQVNIVPGTLTGTAGGQFVVNADLSARYTPPANVFGINAERIVYTITDGELTATGTITVNITAVNDAPVANNDPNLTVDELTTNNELDVLANDTAGPNEPGQTIRIARIVTAPTNGTAAVNGDGSLILYTPNAEFVGVETLTYVIVDSEGVESSAATATIDVVPVIRPRARNDAQTVAEDSGATTINLIANDLANEGATVVLDTVGTILAAQGTLTRTGNTVQFTPAANFFGPVTFTYTITDTSNPVIDTPEEIAASTGTVTITVTPVNDAPVFVPDPVVNAVEDTPITIPAGPLLANDTPGPANESSQTLSVTAVAATSTNGGTVTLNEQSFVYIPRTDYNGPDSFTYTISDSGGATSTGTVSLLVAAINDAPVLNLATGLTAAEDVATTFSPTTILGTSRPGPATATDEANQTLSIVSVGTAGATQFGGTVSLVGGQIRYLSAQNYFGPDSFAVTVRDSGGAESVGTVAISVTPVCWRLTRAWRPTHRLNSCEIRPLDHPMKRAR